MSERACKNCRLLSRERICPNCRGSDLSEDYTGLIIILDAENSELAKMAGLKGNGRYALRVR
ncbi:MAG: transcription elongation factor subunit Spt4 [Candidatus Bathyarchaeia archaeon]